jgi:hypothetical protein
MAAPAHPGGVAFEAIKANLNSASALVREAAELGSEDPIDDAARLVLILCNLSGWSASEISADPDSAIAFARDVDVGRQENGR